MSFSCIYCKHRLPAEQSSRSHVIPRSLGGPIVLHKAVCKKCNRRIATEVEDPFKDRWAWLLNCLEIKGRRGKVPSFDAVVNIVGSEVKIKVRSEGRPAYIPPILEEDDKGKKGIHFIGPPDYVEKKKAEYHDRHPGTTWKEYDTNTLRSFDVVFEIDVRSLETAFARRLAAKIAFEFWALKRNQQMLLDVEYDAVREFVIAGVEGSKPISGLISDEMLIRNNLKISLPNHAVCLVMHSGSSTLGAVVVVFGLFYYWVVLNRRYPLSVNISELTVINPQSKDSVDAILVGSARHTRIPWERLLVPDATRIEKVWNLAREKIENARNAS